MRKKIASITIGLVITFLLGNGSVYGCTNFLITRGATVDGSTMITYSADSHELYGFLYHSPAQDHAAGAMRDIYEWDTGKFLGRIKQLPHTYAVVGLMNEHQVAIGETTFGGREELQNPEGIVDYGSAMYIALERAKTAREAVKVIADLYDEYGYYSSGESFSISDPQEVWIMEIIGKGPGEKGAAWVARRVPDGYVCAHANQSRIRQFPLNDPQNCLYAKDVISFAREKGYFKGEDKDFGFADAYAPADFGALRFCEGRVWCMFHRVAPSQNIPIDFAKGVDGALPMPLWIKPDKKLSVHDLMQLMRDHFEGTEFDMTKDVGAGPFVLPYRWRPLTWKVDGVEYFNERAVSTQQTGFSFVSQCRSWLPGPIGGIHWFGLDDTFSTCYIPMYCGIYQVPPTFAESAGSFEAFSWDSAWWVFNFVANYSYSRYCDMIKDVQKVQQELEAKFLGEVAQIDAKAVKLFQEDPEKARRFLTQYSLEQGEMTVKRWKKLGEHLLWKYLDGNVKDEDGKVTHPLYPEAWYRVIVKETGDHLKVRVLKTELQRNYQDAVTKGDDLFKKKDLQKAKESFEEALKLKPEEIYPKNRIADIDRLSAEIDKLFDKIDPKK